jgi:transposase-like protein
MVEQNKGTVRKNRKYYWSFKRKVIMDFRLDEGASISELARRHGIDVKLLQYWIKKYTGEARPGNMVSFRGMTIEERQHYELLQQQQNDLKKQLELERMKVKALEILIDLTKEKYGLDVRKNFGAKQSPKRNSITRRPR